MASSDSYCNDTVAENNDGLDKIAIKESLLTHIASSLSSFVLPGIVFDGVSPVHLPLSFELQQALVKVSRLAPFGKNYQTLVDEQVRKIWEINGSKVSFGNPF
jgi:hypothetical protein